MRTEATLLRAQTTLTALSTSEPADDVALAAGGDVRAFERLYRANLPKVHSLVRRMTAGRDADELTQDVFVRVWQKLGTFRGESAFGTWLHRLAVNVVLGSRRSEGIRVGKVFGTDDLEAYETPTRPPDPGQALDLERAIATLPPGAKMVFVLHDVEGYKHEEIAELHGIAVGTCKAQLHRARRLLREALDR